MLLGASPLGVFALTQIPFLPPINTDGSSGAPAGASAPGADKRRRYGLERPVKRRLPDPVAARTPLPIPPFKRPLLPGEQLPVLIIDPRLIPDNLFSLQSEIYSAQDIADIQDVIDSLDDIEDVLDLID